MKIALLGGSFNPPHSAHQLACLLLLEAEGFDSVWLLPCFRHAFAKPLADFEHRLEMCRLLAEPFGGRVVVSDVERQILDAGFNRTLDTMDHLSREHPEHHFWLVVGSDLLAELPGWKGFSELRRRFPVFVLRRAGHPASDNFPASAIELPAVSSTQVREILGSGGRAAGLLPRLVSDYILRHGLYGVSARV